MNRKISFLICSLTSLVILFSAGTLAAQNSVQEFPKSFSIVVTNPLPQPRTQVLVKIDEQLLHQHIPAFNSHAFVVLDGKKEIASQYNRGDQKNKGIVLVLDQLPARGSKTLSIRYKEEGSVQRSYTKRTQAEISHKVGGEFKNRKYVGGSFQNIDSLRVPDEHTDHSYYIRYEGPGWESDKVGYRFYLDWRNAVDVFGKTTDAVVLQQVGQDGFDSYHEMQDWGMDVLKVGKSLGVGSLAIFQDGKAIRIEKTDSVNARISENGVVYSSITTNYYGWQLADQKLDIESILGIHAGSRLTHHQVTAIGSTPQNFSTGLIKDAKAKLHSSTGDKSSWGYLASWGPQSLNNDQLGIAVLFRAKDLQEFTQDENSHVVKLKPTQQGIEYYFLAAWELEPGGIKTEAQFLEYLKQTAKELANPVQLNIVSK